jgi:dTDP-4-amino-4,6-dideoxygalactose transaminase
VVIPFNKPVQLGNELAAIGRAFTGGQTAGCGPLGDMCEVRLREMLGCRALLVSSCTHALEMAALLLNVGPEDEVILPSFTFVSTANAFVLRGARPVFADVDENGNLDVGEVERLRTPRTRAICVVHYAGNSCDMDALALAAQGLPIVEDAAQALGAAFRGKPLGSFGFAGAISFHETKNVGCGEGGALVVSGREVVERAEYIREKGTNRRRFHQGLVDKYTWVDVGSSYVLSELNAAYLLPQLEAFATIQRRRHEVFHAYELALREPAERVGAALLSVPPGNTPNSHLFALVFRRAEQRTAYIAHMRQHGILTPFHYVALHRSPMGQRFHQGQSLPMSEHLTGCLVRLPIFFNITNAEVDTVIGRTVEFLREL